MKKLMRFLVPVMLALVILASCAWYLFVYDRDFSRDMLLQQARYHDLHGNPKISAMFYDLAYDFSGQDQNVAIELANQYKADGNYTKAEFTLTNSINDSATAELYMALCKTYVEQDKLLDAVNLLANIGNAEIKAQLEAMRPEAPSADHAPGFYSQYIDVALTASEGKLYYSTEAEYPSIEDPAYSQPITLPGGETVIYAIAVADNGLVSPLSIMGYTVAGVIEPAIFMDASIEAAVRAIIGEEDNDILYTDELWDITEFTVPEGVHSFEDLKLMPHLKTLTILDQKMTTLADIAYLTKLETLDLTGCRFPAEDLSYLASLPNLTKLTLSSCGLSTIAGLNGASSLVTLDISGNGGIRNLEALSNMNTLEVLYLQHNALSNHATSLGQLSGLTNLKTLDISYNSVTSLEPVSSCVKLIRLCADGNQLTNLDGISGLSLMEHLSLDYNKLTDVSTLGSCMELTNLSIANNEITDISSLDVLVKLEILDFSYNKVTSLPTWDEACTLRTIDGSYNELTSIDNLNTLDHISYVYMDYNKLTSVNALENCHNLVQVNVFGNDIKDVSKLTAHDIIVNYDPT